MTVTWLVGTPPEPASIEEIWIGSAKKAPTISNSGLLFAKASGFRGYLLSIFLFGDPDPVLYALETFA